MGHASLLVAVFLSMLAPPVAGQLNQRLYQQACDGGGMLECNFLGIMYATGDGVAQDLGRAATLFQQACDGEILESCLSLGVMYGNGTGVTQDLGRAIALFEQACDGGATQGCSQRDQLVGLIRLAVLQQLPLEDRTLAIGAERSGRLSADDPEGPDGSFVQAWALSLSAGQEVTADLISSDFDARLLVTGPGLASELNDDDSGGGCDARITFTAPQDGEYRAIVNTAYLRETGAFVLRVSDTPPAMAPRPCRRSLAVDLSADRGSVEGSLTVYLSSADVPCEYEVIRQVSGSRTVTSIQEYVRARDDVLRRAAARVGADAVLIPDDQMEPGRGNVGLQVRVRNGIAQPTPGRFSGEAIRFIPGSCGSAAGAPDLTADATLWPAGEYRLEATIRYQRGGPGTYSEQYIGELDVAPDGSLEFTTTTGLCQTRTTARIRADAELGQAEFRCGNATFTLKAIGGTISGELAARVEEEIARQGPCASWVTGPDGQPRCVRYSMTVSRRMTTKRARLRVSQD